MPHSRAARDELVTANLRLVGPIAVGIRRTLPTFELDDLIGWGMLGLVKAADTYKPESGTPFSQWARCKIRGAILDGIGAHGAANAGDSLKPSRPNNQIAWHAGRNGLETLGRKKTPVVPISADGFLSRKIYDALDPQERALIELVYRDGKKCAEAGRLINIEHGNTANHIRRRALQKLRKRIERKAA